jgi:hypothetical protein
LENGCIGLIRTGESTDGLFRNIDSVVARLIVDNNHLPVRARLIRFQYVRQTTVNIERFVEGWDHNGETGLADVLIVVVPERWS